MMNIRGARSYTIIYLTLSYSTSLPKVFYLTVLTVLVQVPYSLRYFNKVPISASLPDHPPRTLRCLIHSEVLLRVATSTSFALPFLSLSRHDRNKSVASHLLRLDKRTCRLLPVAATFEEDT